MFVEQVDRADGVGFGLHRTTIIEPDETADASTSGLKLWLFFPSSRRRAVYPARYPCPESEIAGQGRREERKKKYVYTK